MGVIAKYKFNNTLADLLPEFNSEFTSDLYTVTDEVNGEVTTRTIESDSLPTLMKFGRVWVEGELPTNNRTDSLLEVLEMNTNGLIDCSSMFRYNKNLTSISCEWNTSNVVNMNSMFASCNNLTTLDLSNFNTSSVTNMNNMFSYCTKLTTLDISNWNTNNVTNMSNMFFGCNNLTVLDVSNFNTSNVNNMDNMFKGCFKLTSLDVSNFNTSNVTNMHQMFRDCSSLVSLDVSRFDTSKVATMYCMFYNCKNLTELDVSNWNTSNVETMYSMFCDCTRLLSLDISKWDTNKVTNIDYMFSGYNYDMNLVSLDINNFNIDNINNDYSHLFERMPYLKYLKCKNTNVLNILLPYLPTKSSTSQGTIICKSDITNLDTTALQSKYWNILDEPTLIAKYVFDKSIHSNCIPYFNTEFEGYFIEDEVVEGSNEVTRTIESCGVLPTKIQFGNSNGQDDFNRRMSLLKMLNICNGLTSCQDMFAQCKHLLSVCDIDTSNVTNMYTMFYQCTNLTTLNVSNFNTSNVTNMRYMFYDCNKLTTLNVSNFDTSNVTNMQSMFHNCKNLTSLDVSNFNTSNVTNMYSMFSYCTNLTTLDVSNFDTSNVTDTINMFTSTPNLKDIIMLNCNLSTIQTVASLLSTTHTQTIWHNLSKADEELYQAVEGVELKRYEENEVEVKLNSPLLEGDKLVVKDGKLCHVHRWEKVMLDGSEDEGWQWRNNDDRVNTYNFHCELKKLGAMQYGTKGFSDNFKWGGAWNDYEHIWLNEAKYLTALISIEKITSHNANLFKQWLSENPTTVIYELETPYYEDITNLQSAPTLKTYLECSMKIDTDLPIDTNVTYRTNLSSVYVMERELDELDNGTDLGDILEGEVNE